MFEETIVTGADGARLRVRTGGAGRAVLMLHGFLADAERNFIQPGIASALVDAGFFLILPDHRGHGGSDKPGAPQDWPPDVLAADAEAVLRAFDLIDYDLVGYSLGARTAVRMLARGGRPRRLVLGGMGAAGIIDAGARAAFFEDCIRLGDHARDPRAGRRIQRMMADAGLAPEPLLGVLSSLVPTDRKTLATLTTPTLIVCGTEDEDNGSPEALAALMPDARAVRTPGDHMTAVAAPELAAAVADFLRAPGEAV